MIKNSSIHYIEKCAVDRRIGKALKIIELRVMKFKLDRQMERWKQTL